MIRIRQVHNSENIVIKRNGIVVYRGGPEAIAKCFSKRERGKIQRYIQLHKFVENIVDEPVTDTQQEILNFVNDSTEEQVK